MRLHRILCPKCNTALTSKAGIPEGQQLNCPKCKGRFTAEAPVDAVEVVDDTDVVEDDFEVVDDDEPPPPKKKPVAPAKAEKRRSVDDDEDDVPRRKRKQDEDDEDDEAPRSRRRTRDDDEDDEDDEDDDDRARRRKKGGKQKSGYQKLKGNIWVRVATLTVLLAVLGVVVFLYIQKIKKDREAEEFNRDVAERERQNLQPVDPARAAAEKQRLEEDRRLTNRLAGQWKLAEGEPLAAGLENEYELKADTTYRITAMVEGERRSAGAGNWYVTAAGRDSGTVGLFPKQGGGGIEVTLSFTLSSGDNEVMLQVKGTLHGARYVRVK